MIYAEMVAAKACGTNKPLLLTLEKARLRDRGPGV